MEDWLSSGDSPLETLSEKSFLCLIGDDKGVVREGLLWVGEKVLVVLKGSSNGGDRGRRSGRVAVEVVLVDILILDGSGESRLLGLNGALDDRVVRLDLVKRKVVLGAEDGTMALAGHGLGVEGVDWAFGKLVDSKDTGLLVAEAVVGTPVTAVVDVERREVELSLRDQGHADVSVLRLRHGVELLGRKRGRSGNSNGRSRGRWHRGDGLLGLEAVLAGELIEEGGESLVTEQALDEGARAGILLAEEAVLGAEVVGLLDLDGNFALELADVFYALLVKVEETNMWRY